MAESALLVLLKPAVLARCLVHSRWSIIVFEPQVLGLVLGDASSSGPNSWNDSSACDVRLEIYPRHLTG